MPRAPRLDTQGTCWEVDYFDEFGRLYNNGIMGAMSLLDEEDDKFIECAIALKAEVIITGDKALRAINEYMGIKILTPQQFLRTKFTET